jgi:penicillin-binding protein 2
MNIHTAIPQSCDVFFYTLAERLGISKIAKWATALGLGQRTGVDLPQEVAGVMPSEEWKAKYYKQKWYAGETISVGIGQGAVATTPIQLARAIGAINSGGMLRRPHVVDPGTQPEKDFQGKYQQAMATSRSEARLDIDPENWNTITDAMAAVVNPGGTAAASHLDGIDFAGKTGSAQVVSNDARKVLKGSQFKDNGWFAGVEPRRNPEIVVVVLMEEGEHGSAAAHLASDVVKAYVDKRRKRATKVAQAATKPIEMVAVWSAPNEEGEANEHLQGGRFVIVTGGKPRKPVKAAPGIGVVLKPEPIKPVVQAHDRAHDATGAPGGVGGGR